MPSQAHRIKIEADQESAFEALTKQCSSRVAVRQGNRRGLS
jgi:hypothetical protein